MLYVEDDARIVLENAVKKYESYFDEDFPLLAYADETVNIDVAFNIEKIVNKAIVDDKPVNTPKDYSKRLY